MWVAVHSTKILTPLIHCCHDYIGISSLSVPTPTTRVFFEEEAIKCCVYIQHITPKRIPDAHQLQMKPLTEEAIKKFVTVGMHNLYISQLLKNVSSVVGSDEPPILYPHAYGNVYYSML